MNQSTNTNTRRVRILAAGGTIAMTGESGATPELDADALVKGVPGLDGREGLSARTIVNCPARI